MRIKSFLGTSHNAVKTQLWIAVSVYVLIAIIRKRLNLELNLHTILQVLSLTVFEKMPIEQLLTQSPRLTPETLPDNQLNLFDLTLGR